MRIAKYDSQTDNLPESADVEWEALAKALCDHERTPCDPCPGKACTHKFGKAWSPVVIAQGQRRSNDNVQAVTAAVFDLDHVTREQLTALAPRLEGYAFVIHSTHSHRPDDLAFRLVMPLSAPVPAHQWREFLAKAIAHFQIPADPSCKDLSRLYFVPSCPAKGPAPKATRKEGRSIDVEAILGHALEATIAAAPVIAPKLIVPEPSKLTDAERTSALRTLGNALAKLETENAELAQRIVEGADVLGKQGADANTGHPGQDNMLQKVARLVAAMADPGLTAADLLEVVKPSLRKANWGEGFGHLCGEAHAKLERAVLFWREKKATESAEREALKRATADFMAKKLGSAESAPASVAAAPSAPAPTEPPDDPPSGGAPAPSTDEPTAEAEYNPLTDAPEPPPPSDVATWQSESIWQTDKNGEPTGTLAKDPANIAAWLSHNPDWKGVIRRNKVTKDIELHGGPLALNTVKVLDGEGVTEIRNHLARDDGARDSLRFGSNLVEEQLALVAKRNAYDPLKDYLEGLKWNGTPGLETWAHDYLGVAYENDIGEDITTHVKAVSKRWMIGAVARALRPGCKMDTVLILEGAQGVGKSSALKVLGGDWFSDDAGHAFGDKDTKLLISRVWIQEMPELDAMKKGEVSALKAWFSRAEDFYRAPYDRAPAKHPRRAVFAGTTNPETYLQDDTGNRRYWPLKCTAVNLPALRAARDQLWAEAVALFKAGEQWHLTLEETTAVAAETEARMMVDEGWGDRILRWWLEKGKPEEVSTADALVGLNFTADRMDRASQIRAGAAMKQVGFLKRRKREGARRTWIYIPGPYIRDLNLTRQVEQKPGLKVVPPIPVELP